MHFGGINRYSGLIWRTPCDTYHISVCVYVYAIPWLLSVKLPLWLRRGSLPLFLYSLCAKQTPLNYLVRFVCANAYMNKEYHTVCLSFASLKASYSYLCCLLWVLPKQLDTSTRATLQKHCMNSHHRRLAEDPIFEATLRHIFLLAFSLPLESAIIWSATRISPSEFDKFWFHLYIPWNQKFRPKTVQVLPIAAYAHLHLLLFGREFCRVDLFGILQMPFNFAQPYLGWLPICVHCK